MNYHTNGIDGTANEAGSEELSNELDALPTEEFLKTLGSRVRAQRSTKNMSRKRLAEVSGVSERYLAQLESGQGNMSIALLRKVTSSIGMSLCMLFSGDVSEPGDKRSEHSADALSGSGLEGQNGSGMALGSVAASGRHQGNDSNRMF